MEYFGAVFRKQGTVFNGKLDKVIECDLLPACAFMVRSEVIKEVGFWDRSYFLYWDETDWQKHIKEKGWRLVCCTDSVIWHKNGSSNPTNTRALYYGSRNVVKYFGKYIPEGKIQSFTKYVLWSNFQIIYPSNYKKLYGVIRTIMVSIEDALNGVGGIAGEGRIFARDSKCDLLKTALNGVNNVLLTFDGAYDASTYEKILFNTVMRILQKKIIAIYIYTEREDINRDIFAKRAEFVKKKDGHYDLKLKLCVHVNVDLPNWEEGWCIVDPATNYIDSLDGWMYFKNYPRAWNLFYITHRDVLAYKLYQYHRKVSEG